MVETVTAAAHLGQQTCSIEFRAETTPEYYAFLRSYQSSLVLPSNAIDFSLEGSRAV